MVQIKLIPYFSSNSFLLLGDEEDKSSTPNTGIFPENSTTTSGILRSKDLRSVVEIKRRNFSRSCSSSDSEDNGSNYDMNRPTSRKTTRSPNFFHDSEPLTTHRGRSFSNIEHVLNEIPLNIHQQMVSTNNSENIKRKSFSRTSSIVSTNRLTLNSANDDIHTDTSGANSLTFINDRTRSLSIEHRLANPSQISIGSRTSIRYSTPRESTVFTKTEVPLIVRLIQQTPHQDTTDTIRTIIEYQRKQSISSHQEIIQPAIIIEEDLSPPTTNLTKSNTNLGKKIHTNGAKSNIIVPTKENIRISNGHIPLATVEESFIKQERKSSDDKSTKKKQSKKKHRACCTIS